MQIELFPTTAEYIRLAPESILSLAGTLLMVLNPIVKRRINAVFSTISVGAMLLAICASVYAQTIPGEAFSRMLLVSGYATFFRILLISIGLVVVLGSSRYFKREQADPQEFQALILFSVVGQCIMASANELIVIFVGLEISSIATYILAGYFRDDRRGNEAALKYFLLGSFATAFFLYGVAILYGTSGSTNLTLIRHMVEGGSLPAGALGVSAALMFVGLCFKVSGAPFQVWAPDVYQGASSPVSAFLSAGPKAAAFAVFFRIFLTAFPSISDQWVSLIWISALLSMTIGNLAALSQSNIKRLLAYSSIAHAGYVLVALAAGSNLGTAAAMFYLAAYACMNVGVFLIIGYVSGYGEKQVRVSDFAGLGSRQPLTAFLLTIFLLSLIGVPLTGGFFGKFYIFEAALQSHLVWLTVLGLLNSAIAAYYYLRIIAVVYMEEPSLSSTEMAPLNVSTQLALIIPALGTILLGVFPSHILNFVIQAASLVH